MSMQRGSVLFLEEFKRRGRWTQGHALRWYIENVRNVAYGSKGYRRMSTTTTHHIQLLRQRGRAIGQYPVGVGGRMVTVWLHNDVELDALCGFAGEEHEASCSFEKAVL